MEKLDERYTDQWSRWFPAQLKKDDVNFITVEGEPLTSKLEIGTVLDAYSTNHWKMTQMANLIDLMRKGKVTKNDILLFADLWSPGIEVLQYIGCMGGIRPKITGVLHAGTYDQFDFTYLHGMHPWGNCLEQAWFQMYDLVFVGSQSHKNIILKNHNISPDKIKVTGLPFYPDEFTQSRKKIKKIPQSIIFPHRMDLEKQPGEFVDLIKLIKQEFTNVKYLMTCEHKLNKDKYYDELVKADICISMAQHENWGYAMLEATALGCIPLVPDRLSYQELYMPVFRYKSISELIEKLRNILSEDGECEDFEMERAIEEQAIIHKNLGENAISKMIEAINEIS